MKRLSVVVLAAAVFATPARGVEPAPGVKLRLMNETPFSLESLKGSAVVLDFRAPWCVHEKGLTVVDARVVLSS